PHREPASASAPRLDADAGADAAALHRLAARARRSGGLHRGGEGAGPDERDELGLISPSLSRAQRGISGYTARKEPIDATSSVVRCALARIATTCDGASRVDRVDWRGVTVDPSLALGINC